MLLGTGTGEVLWGNPRIREIFADGEKVKVVYEMQKP